MQIRRLSLPVLFILFMGLLTPAAAQAAVVGRFITASPVAVNTGSNNGYFEDNRCSLVEAIIEAQAPGTFSGGGSAQKNECRVTGSGTPVTITLAARSTYKLTDIFEGTGSDATGLPAITTALTIKASASTTILNAGTAATKFRFFDVKNGGSLTLIGGDYEGDSATSLQPSKGGAILVRDNLSSVDLNGVLFKMNTAADQGGVLANYGTTTVENKSLFLFNQAVGGAGNGGVFYNETGGSLDIGGESDIRNNHSDHNGVGIYNDTGATLTFDDESQLYGNHFETNGQFGAGIYNKGDATITDAVIAKNKGNPDNSISAAGGGGVYNASGGTMSITKTVFVYNEPNAVELAAPLSAFTDNCLYDGGSDGFSGGVSVKDHTNSLDVSHNWWGIASGPGTIAQTYPPAQTQVGDSPTGTPDNSPSDFLTDPTTGCPLTQLDKNASLEPPKPNVAYPASWGRIGMGKLDKLDCTTAFEDNCSFTVNGGVDKKSNPLNKVLTQTVKARGFDEYYFDLEASSKGTNVPANAVYQAVVTIYYYNHTPLSYTIKFATGTTGWQHGAAYFASIETPGNNMFRALKVDLQYQASSGQVWWDNVRLLWCPYP